jgi:hypothetical protein
MARGGSLDDVHDGISIGQAIKDHAKAFVELGGQVLPLDKTSAGKCLLVEAKQHILIQVADVGQTALFDLDGEAILERAEHQVIWVFEAFAGHPTVGIVGRVGVASGSDAPQA